MPRLKGHEIQLAYEESKTPTLEDILEEEARESEEFYLWEQAVRVKYDLHKFLKDKCSSSNSIISFVNDKGEQLFEYDADRDLLVDRIEHCCYAGLKEVFFEHDYDKGYNSYTMLVSMSCLQELTREEQFIDIFNRILKLKIIERKSS